jgi:hypothetical protein
VDAGGYAGTTNWRRGRDSNPRYGCPYAAFRVRCIQPLCHLSNYLILIFFLLSHLAARWPFAPFAPNFGWKRACLPPHGTTRQRQRRRLPAFRIGRVRRIAQLLKSPRKSNDSSTGAALIFFCTRWMTSSAGSGFAFVWTPSLARRRVLDRGPSKLLRPPTPPGRLARAPPRSRQLGHLIAGDHTQQHLRAFSLLLGARRARRRGGRRHRV